MPNPRFPDSPIPDCSPDITRLLKLAASQAGYGIVMTDRDERITWVNQGFSKIAGYSLEEVIGRKPGEILQGELSSSEEKSRMRKAIDAQQPFNAVLLNYHKKGWTYWIDITGHPIFADNGVFEGFVAIQQDATEKVKTRMQLEANLAILDAVAKMGQSVLASRLEATEWRATLEILGDSVKADRAYVFKCHTDLVTGEPACSQLAEWVASGISAQIDAPELQNLRWSTFSMDWHNRLREGHPIHGDIDEFNTAELRALLNSQEIKSILIVPIFCQKVWWGVLGFDYCRKPRRWLQSEVSLLVAAASTLGLRIAQQKDEDRLQEAMQAAQSANIAKSKFLATISHEIRTPLNCIIGYTQLLRRNRHLSKTEIHQIESIHRSGQHLLTLINDILDISKIEAGKVQLEMQDFDLIEFIDDILEMLQSRAQEKSLDLSRRLIFEPPQEVNKPTIIVESDTKALRQILINLIGNAVKFTKAGSVTVEVEILTQTAQRAVEFRVIDTGVGIPEQHIASLFKAFTQLHNDEIEDQGTGLGLSIADGLVKLLGGSLECSSRIGQGSVFSFRLPMNWHVRAKQKTRKPQESKQDHFQSITGYQGARKAILIVDDMRDNRTLLRDVLSPIGFIINEAINGNEALKLLKKEKFDLILCDLLMPVMDGSEFARTVRRDPGLTHNIIIAVSASLTKDNRSGFREEHCFDDVLSKPIDTEELLNMIAQQLNLNWMLGAPMEKNHDASLPQSPQDQFRSVENSELPCLSNEDRRTLIDIIAHDIRSPLSAALGFVEVLNEEIHESDESSSNSQYLGYIIESLRTIQAVTQGMILINSLPQHELMLEDCDVRHLLDTSIERLENREFIPVGYVRLVALSESVSITSDAGLLQELLQILIQTFATLAGPTDHLALTWKTSQTKHQTTLEFEATGRVMDEHECEIFFHPFRNGVRRRVRDVGFNMIAAQLIMEKLHIESAVIPVEEGNRYTLQFGSLKPIQA